MEELDIIFSEVKELDVPTKGRVIAIDLAEIPSNMDLDEFISLYSTWVETRHIRIEDV